MSIGDHTNKMQFELAVRPPGYLYGYLPMGWLKDDNPDINSERESLKLLPEYQDYTEIFREEKIKILPEHTKYNHRVDFVPGSDLPKNQIYQLTVREQQVLK